MNEELTNQGMLASEFLRPMALMSIGQDIARGYIAQVGEQTALRVLFNRHLEPELLRIFSIMDQGVCVAGVTDALGYDFCRTYLNKPDLHKIGYLVSRTEDQLRQDYKIPLNGVEKIKRYLKDHGLRLGMDTAQWNLYRQFVPKGFELIRLEEPEAPAFIVGSQDYLV